MAINPSLLFIWPHAEMPQEKEGSGEEQILDHSDLSHTFVATKLRNVERTLPLINPVGGARFFQSMGFGWALRAKGEVWFSGASVFCRQQPWAPVLSSEL